MKKILLTASTIVLTLGLLAGCSKTLTELPDETKPSGSVTNPATESTTEPTVEATPTETEENIQYEGEASSYYIDEVYAQQIQRYDTAVSQKWDENAYLDHNMSPLAASYYEGNAQDNVGFGFADLDNDGIWELMIGGIQNAEKDPLVFEIWTLNNDEPVMLAQSGSHNRYYMQHSEENDVWFVAYEAENGAANRAVYYLQLSEGKFNVTQGVVFDAAANEESPWFMAYDLDWDVSNDTPIDEETAYSVMNAERNTYAAPEYFPYSLYE